MIFGLTTQVFFSYFFFTCITSLIFLTKAVLNGCIFSSYIFSVIDNEHRLTLLKANSELLPYQGTTSTIVLIYSGVLKCLAHTWSPMLNNDKIAQWSTFSWKGPEKGIWSNSLLKAGLMWTFHQIAHRNVKF